MLCSNLSTSHEEPSEVENDNGPMPDKHGYGQSGLNKRDREAAGLFYLSTVYLPERLENNLKKYLKSKVIGFIYQTFGKCLLLQCSAFS